MKGLSGRLARPFGRPARGPAVIAGLGCALPLLLGMFSGHPGFYWATLGAFLATLAHPLRRLGMLCMLLSLMLGAFSVALGFWAAPYPFHSLFLFAVYGLLLAWLQRPGDDTGKLGICLAICLSLGHGQGQYGLGNFDNPYAIAMLFSLGGLWVSLLGFGLRGIHGLRMWPYLPPLRSLARLWRRNTRQAFCGWWLYASACLTSAALGGFLVSFLQLQHGYWLTLTVFAGLHHGLQRSLLRVLLVHAGILALASLLITLGFSLGNSPLAGLIMLPLIVLFRTFQAQTYRLFVVQTGLSFLLLSETLAQDWDAPQPRMLSVVIGVGVGLLMALPMPFLNARLARRRRTGQPTENLTQEPTTRA